MKALYSKEFRNLIPVFCVFLLFFCGDIIFFPLAQPLDEASWFDRSGGLSTDGVYPFSVYMMGIIVGYSLFPREYEEHTIDFLHSLPVTRHQIFLAKWAAGASVTAIVCVLQELMAAGFQCFDGNSLTAGDFSFVTFCKLILLSVFSAWEGLAHGILLSYLRQFGFLFLGFAGWAIRWLKTHFPYLEHISPLSITEPVFDGLRLVVPWKALLAHGLVALFSLWLARFLWSTRGYQGTDLIVEGVKRHRKKMGCFTALAVMFLVVVFVRGIDDDAEEAPSIVNARMSTGHYSFTFPVNFRHRAVALALSADSIYEYVDKALGGVPSALVVADLTDQSAEHLGIASLDKLRVDIFNNEEPALLEHVLCHETTHVLCNRLGGDRGRNYGEELSFFSEGTAEFMAFERGECSRTRSGSRRHAVAMYVRHRVKFDTMTNGEAKEKYDDSLSYTLGELWVQALVDCYGPQAPSKVWRSVGRDKAPSIDKPLTFWHDTLQAAGFSFERVRDRWLAHLKHLEAEEKDFLAQLPKVRARAVTEDEGVYLEATCDKPIPEDWPGMIASVRARNGEQAQALQVEPTDDPNVFQVEVPELYGRTFDYQFGIQFSKDAYPVVEEWKTPTKVK